MIRMRILERLVRTALAVGLLPCGVLVAAGEQIAVRDAQGLGAALAGAGPGTTIVLAPGRYGHGLTIEKLSGTKEARITIKGADDRDPPLFEGGNEAIHLTDCNFLTLRNLKVSGCAGNGINCDDGGTFDTPSRGMVFENLVIEGIGPTGNHDGLKLSGLDDFTVRGCRVSGWGGSAIDMVGCHDGVIEGCRIVGKDGFSQDTGVQAKGGCERVVIKGNLFHGAGQRAVNLGGSTGLPFFRPRAQGFEARDLEVSGNHFVGCEAAVAFVTSSRCVVRRNTFMHPGKWVMRILQEQPTDKFQPCQSGVFEANLVVFDGRVGTIANVGPNTRPETFVFRGNAWFCSDGDRRLPLPAEESAGIHQVDPKVEDAGPRGWVIRSNDERLRGVGAPPLGG